MNLSLGLFLLSSCLCLSLDDDDGFAWMVDGNLSACLPNNLYLWIINNNNAAFKSMGIVPPDCCSNATSFHLNFDMPYYGVFEQQTNHCYLYLFICCLSCICPSTPNLTLDSTIHFSFSWLCMV